MKLILFVVCLILGAWIIELIVRSMYNASIGNDKYKHKKKRIVMNDKQEVCVVHVETRRFFDECQNSYLPLMHPIFGVYSTSEKAQEAVMDYFTNRFKEQYEVCFEDFDIDGERLDCDVCFKRVDKVFGGCAFYCNKTHCVDCIIGMNACERLIGVEGVFKKSSKSFER